MTYAGGLIYSEFYKEKFLTIALPILNEIGYLLNQEEHTEDNIPIYVKEFPTDISYEDDEGLVLPGCDIFIVREENDRLFIPGFDTFKIEDWLPLKLYRPIAGMGCT